MSRTNCDHCTALVTPGAPFCLACFVPFPDDEPAAAAPAPPVGFGIPEQAAPLPAAVGVGAGYAAGPPATAAAAGPNDFYAAPPVTTHPGQGVDWRVAAPGAALLAPSRRAPKSRLPLVVAGVVGVLLLGATVVGGRALLAGPSEKEEFAIAFREARPPDLLPSLPDLESLRDPSTEPEVPGQARAFVEAHDPKVRAANAALLAMQRTMDGWADGDVSDDALRAEIKKLHPVLDAASATSLEFTAPDSTRRGLGKLRESATEYRLALGALLDWLDSGTGGSRMMYRLSVGSANLHWDEGLVNLYRAAGLPTPPLPHPQPKK